MYYFIPAWYGKERPWHADLTPWYFSHFKLEFELWQVSSLRSLLTKSSMPCTKSDQVFQLPFVKRPRVDLPLHLLVAAYKKKSSENKLIY